MCAATPSSTYHLNPPATMTGRVSDWFLHYDFFRGALIRTAWRTSRIAWLDVCAAV